MQELFKVSRFRFELALVISLCSLLTAHAAPEEKHGAHDKHEEPKTILKAGKDSDSEIRVHVGAKEVAFDLSKDSDVKDFIAKIKKGEIVEIKIEANPLEFKADLGLWALVIFVALLFILRKLAWGPMVEGLQKREQSIRSAVDEAKLAREETERLRAQFKTEMDQAFAKIPVMMEEARRQGEKLAEEMRAKAAADIAADRDRLRREIAIGQGPGPARPSGTRRPSWPP